MQADEPKISSIKPTPSRAWLKYLTVAIWVALMGAAIWFLFGTELGSRVWSHTETLSRQSHQFVRRHWLLAPVVFVAVYIFLGLLALPIWWLQLLGGVGFGLYYGCGLSLIGSTVSATLSVLLVRWLAADWFHQRVESRMEKLRSMDELMGHNGFLVVMTIRLMHMLPFGLCNYALGLSKVSYLDVALGTLIGNIPAAAIYVGVGAGYDFWHNWKFAAVVGALNVVLLLPLVLRYLRPGWFAKIGVE